MNTYDGMNEYDRQLIERSNKSSKELTKTIEALKTLADFANLEKKKN